MPSRLQRRRLARKRIVGIAVAATLCGWLAVACWNVLKPLPAGTHYASRNRRFADADIDYLAGAANSRDIMTRELTLIGRAEELIVLDQSPVAREISQALLVRQHARPRLKIVLLTDAVNHASGRTEAADLITLERAGIIVVRMRLTRLRDSNPAYSALWRMAIGWWSDPFDEAAASSDLRARLRRLNFQASQRQLLVADDGAGGWVSIFGPPDADLGLVVRGTLAHDVIASELAIAQWSAADDRLPAAPPAAVQGLGTVDARYLTEGAVPVPLLEAINATTRGDRISISASYLAQRRLVEALQTAASRGVHLQLLLHDAYAIPNGAVMDEIAHAGGNVEIRRPTNADSGVQLVMIRHGADSWVFFGSSQLTRRGLDDLNLGSMVELRMPAQAAASRELSGYFDAQWARSAAVRSSSAKDHWLYWRYRLSEAGGFSSF